MARTTLLRVEARLRGYGRGWDVYLDDTKIGHRPADGSYSSEVEDEVVTALAGLLRTCLGWNEDAPEDDE